MMTKRGQEVLRLVLTFDKKVNLWRARTTMYPDLTWLLILPTTFFNRRISWLISKLWWWKGWWWAIWMNGVNAGMTIGQWLQSERSFDPLWPVDHLMHWPTPLFHTIPYHIKVSNLTNLCNNLEKSKYQFWQIHVTSDQLTTSCTGLHLELCFTPYYTISKYQFWQIHVTSDQLTTSCTGLHLCFTPYHTISKYQIWQIYVTT